MQTAVYISQPLLSIRNTTRHVSTRSGCLPSQAWTATAWPGSKAVVRVSHRPVPSLRDSWPDVEQAALIWSPARGVMAARGFGWPSAVRPRQRATRRRVVTPRSSISPSSLSHRGSVGARPTLAAAVNICYAEAYGRWPRCVSVGPYAEDHTSWPGVSLLATARRCVCEGRTPCGVTACDRAEASGRARRFPTPRPLGEEGIDLALGPQPVHSDRTGAGASSARSPPHLPRGERALLPLAVPSSERGPG